MIEETELLDILRAQCDQAGSVFRWANDRGIPPTWVYAVLNEKSGFAPKILRAMGYEKKCFFFACNADKDSA